MANRLPKRGYGPRGRNAFGTKRDGRYLQRASSLQSVDPAAVFRAFLTDINEGNNGFAWCCCPFHTDRNPSFCLNLRTGWHRCLSSNCGAGGRNIVGFVGRLLTLSERDARTYLERHYG